MSWIVVSYFTDNSPYPEHATHLIRSLRSFNLPYEVTPMKDLGDWQKNTQFKATFLQQKLKRFRPHSLVCVDCDAVFYRYPDYFDKLDIDPSVNIAVHVLDHSKYSRRNHPPELLSGTIFLRNTPTTSIIVNAWIAACRKSPMLWDQRALASVLQNFPYHQLPAEYCTIFDLMKSVQNPVIKHFQASREVRRAKKNSPKTNQVFVVKRKK